MEYLQCTQKSKTKHKIKINERNSYKFNTSKHIHLPYVNDIMEYPPYIISKSLIIMVYIIQEIFDPFNTGEITKENFFSIIALLDFLNPITEKINLSNMIHLNKLKNQVLEYFSLFKQYSADDLLHYHGLEKMIEENYQKKSKNLQEIDKTSLNFSSFLKIIPIFLD